MKKLKVFQQLTYSGIVAVMRNMTPDKVIEIVTGLQSAGIKAIEITIENESRTSVFKKG